MAGEVKGKVYEAIVYVVLKKLQDQGKITEQVFWNEIPEGMTIEPDFLIGSNKDIYKAPK